MKNKLWLLAPAALAAALSTAALGVALAGAAEQRVAAGPVPTTVAYQGFLTDVRGTPVPNGARTITFRLYGSPTGGTALWQETQTLATDRGVFNAMLGSASAFGNAFDTAPLYLGVQLAGEAELRPRQQLAATPFALRAANADALGGAPASAFVRNAGTGLQATQILGQRALGLDETYRLPQGCDAGKVAKWGFTSLNSQGWICGGDIAGGNDVDTSSFQTRITGRCPVNRAMRGVNADGTPLCFGPLAEDDHPHPVPAIELRYRSESVVNDDRARPIDVLARCRPGERAVGGGFRLQRARANPVDAARALQSRPHAADNGWFVEMKVPAGQELYAYAVCMKLEQP